MSEAKLANDFKAMSTAFQQAKEELDRTKAALDVAVMALEFYRDENNWIKDFDLPCSYIIADTGFRAKGAIKEIKAILAKGEL